MQYVILQLPLSSCQNVTVNLYYGINIYFFFSFSTHISLSFFSAFFLFVLCSSYFSVIYLTLSMPLQLFMSPFLSPAVSLPSHIFSPSYSLYQPPRRRPSAVWSPCAATNMGRAAVPAWPASWSKWPGSARPAPTIAKHPAAATGGEDDNVKKHWLWILMNLLLLVSKICAAALSFLAPNVVATLFVLLVQICSWVYRCGRAGFQTVRETGFRCGVA